MSADGQKAAEWFSQAKNEALSLIGVLIGGKGLETVLVGATNRLADLGRQARNIGESADNITTFTNAIAANGGTADAARASLEGLAKAKQDLATGGRPDLPGLLSIIGADRDSSPLAIMMKFMQFVERNKNNPQGIQQIQQIGARLPLDQGLVNAMIQIGTLAKYEQELADARKRGVPTPEMIKAYTDLQKAFEKTQQAASFLTDTLLSKVAPGLTHLLDQLTKDLTDPAKIITPEDVLKPGRDQQDDPLKQGNWQTFGQEPGWLGAIIWGWLTGAKPWTSSSGGLGAGGLGSGSAEVDAGARARAKAVHDGLVARGMDDDTAWGFAANAVAESGARSDRVEMNGGPGRGLFQITSPDRKAAFLNRYGHSPEQASLDEQLDFVKFELNTSERGAAFRIGGAGGGAAGKAAAISEFFERPKNTEAEKQNRAAIARALATPDTRQLVTRVPFGTPLDPNLIPSRGGPRVGSNDNRTTLEIGSLTVNTQATDAKGIGASIHKALTDQITNAANRGPQ